MIFFDSKICTDFDAASAGEWFETNGIGGFASGTISGAHTRRYHGLLTAATNPPVGRVRMLSKLEETLLIDGERFELSANRYPARIHPDGFKYLRSFRMDPFPIWNFDVGGCEIEKRVFMPHGENTVVAKYVLKAERLGSQPRVSLELRLFVSFVDYHHLQHEDPRFDTAIETTERSVSIRPYEEFPRLFFLHNGSLAEKTGYWYRDFEYSIERERGFDFHEDLFQPFTLEFDLSRPAELIVSTDTHGGGRDASGLESDELKRRRELINRSKAEDEFARQLVLAADQFIVRRGVGHTIIAGYPWFSDWGRDTMIALPGLTLATNRPEIARDILLEFSKNISQGMLPNRFPDAGDEAEYNTVDATLWYFEAIRAYVEHTGDHDVLKEDLYSKLAEIIAWHLRGTRYGIRVDTDGLLHAGEPGIQLTWMDAKIGDLVITPRTGKAVEIQALWYNALRIMQGFACRFGDAKDAGRYEAMADLAKLSFNAVFWNHSEQCLYDVVENGRQDGSVRPNQIFAVSLAHAILDADRSRKVVEKVEAELLTPVGLRSLSPNDPRYVPVYAGSPFDRDSAYHQGTVWAWLTGGFVDAHRKVFPDREERVAEFLKSFEAHLFEAGLGQVSEIFDGDPPHRPRGCPAQAWSIGELMRVKRTCRGE